MKKSYAQTAKQPSGGNQGPKSAETQHSAGSNSNRNISPVSAEGGGVKRAPPSSLPEPEVATLPLKSAWGQNTTGTGSGTSSRSGSGGKKNAPVQAEAKQTNPSSSSLPANSNANAKTTSTPVPVPVLAPAPAPTSSVPKPAPAPTKNAWAIPPKQAPAKPLNFLAAEDQTGNVDNQGQQSPQNQHQHQQHHHQQHQHQPQYDQRNFYGNNSNYNPQQQQQPKKDYQKKNHHQHQQQMQPQQPMPYYQQYQQMQYQMYPMYQMPMPPPNGAPYHPAAPQTPSFQLAQPKRNVIKIVNPHSLEEIKLPVKTDAAATVSTKPTAGGPATKEIAANQPPAAVPATSSITGAAQSSVPSSAVEASPLVKKSSALFFKNPKTGEVVVPKSTPITISKPPATKAAAATVPAAVPETHVATKSPIIAKAAPSSAAVTPTPTPENPISTPSVRPDATSQAPVIALQIKTPSPAPTHAAPNSRAISPAPAPAPVAVAVAVKVVDIDTTAVEAAATKEVKTLSSPASTLVNGHVTDQKQNFSAKSPTPASKPPGFENVSSTSSPAAALEDGEIDQDLLPDLPTLTSFEGLSYPAEILPIDLPTKKAGYNKYSFKFFIAVGKIVHARPPGMANWEDVYGDDSQNKPPQMRRQLSDNRGGRGRGAPRGGRGGQVPHMSRQASSGPFSSSSHGSRGGGGGRGGRMKHIPPAPVAPPLNRGENAYDPRKKMTSETDATLKSIKGLLNKMTLDNFEKLCGKVLDSKIEDEVVLVGMITLVYEKAIDEPHFATVYAMLCRRLFQDLPIVQEWICPTGIVKENKFRMHLLKRCQEAFEQDAKWAADDAEAQVERAKLRLRIDELSAEEKLRIAEEDYERTKLKRRVLGNIRFVGELFLQGIISESIIKTCIFSLLKNDDPEEEDIESLCKLVTATGKNLDNESNQKQMNVYFEKMKDLSEMEGKLSSRIRFLLMDVIDLRKNKWVNTKISQVKSIAQVKKEIEMEEREKERAKSQRGKSSGGLRLNKAASFSGNRPDRDDRRSKNNDDGGWKSVGGDQHPKRLEMHLRSGKSHLIKRSPSIPYEKQVATPSAKLTNSFYALENMSLSKPSASSVETDTELEHSQNDIMIEALKNFKDSLEPAELLEDLENVDDETVYEGLVNKLAQLLLDLNGKPASQIVKIFVTLFFKEDAKISTVPFVEGFKKFFVNLEDELSDFPNAFTNLSQVLFPLFAESGIDYDTLVDITSPISAYSGKKPVLPEFLIDFLKLSDSPLRFLIDMQFDIKPFFPEGEIVPSIEKWLNLRTKFVNDAPKLKVFNDVETMHSFIVGLYEAAGLELGESESYRFVSRESDEIAQSESFSNFAYTSFFKVLTMEDVFGGSFENAPAPKTKELFVSLRDQISHLKPILDFMESPLELLLATESFLFGHSISNLLEDVFRIYYDLESVPEVVYFDFKKECRPESDKILTGWFKYLKEH